MHHFVSDIACFLLNHDDEKLYRAISLMGGSGLPLMVIFEA